ncbi:MAG: FISUMP domain-containing protein [Candidatus Staskawiczbacteria bacterium]|nr:FISUMP domain-containing protein [Candidatus Staskawiczbacteria bacterium]
MKKVKRKVISATKKAVHKVKRFFSGFTIIELIIVISIIGVLSGIIAVYAVGYIGKSKDSRIKEEVSEISKGAAMYYANNFSFDGYEVPVSFLPVSTGSDYVFSSDNADAYVVYAKLVTSDNYWCADSSGAVVELENAPDAGVYTCTAGSGGSGGCGIGPECSVGYTCYNNSVCTLCDSNAFCNLGEDCSCGDCPCQAEETCTSNEGSYYCASSWACGDALVDLRDSKVYSTVQIGTQCWMAENLNVGTLITSCTNGYLGVCTSGGDSVQNQGTDCSSGAAIEKYCHSDSEANCTTYGGLYQWSQMMCGSTTAGATGICPTGWHIPTHDEITTLERSVCSLYEPVSSTCATDFPVDTSTTGYRGTNEGTKLQPGGNSGFNGPLIGYRNTSGSFFSMFGYIDMFGSLWSSSESGVSAWNRNLSSGVGTVNRVVSGKDYGFSVRCIKD